MSCCRDCQTALGDPKESYKRYTEDIPPVEPKVTEHTIYGYWCPKCRKTVWPKMTDALKNSQIGLRVVVFSAWLHYLVGVSVSNIVKWLSVFSHLKISPGGLTQAWANLAQLLEWHYQAVAQEINRGDKIHADETGWRVNGRTHWLWSFSDTRFCYYVINRSRGSPVVATLFGKKFAGILLCDFWGAYNKLQALAKQRCLYHLFTELRRISKTNDSIEWKRYRKKLTRLLKDAIRLQSQKSRLDASVYDRRKQCVLERFEAVRTLETSHRDIRRLGKRFKRHQDEMFTFLDYEDLSPYNNHAEQQMRGPVISRKISQQNRSRKGVSTQAVLMTLFRSLQLQGKNPVEALLKLTKDSIEDRLSKQEQFAFTF